MTQTMTRRELLNLPPLVDVPTAARALGVSVNFAYRLAKKGELPGLLRLGSQYRVRTAALHEAAGIQPGEAA
ncbi:MAG: helix-turn-helix domain-containing protein [Acidimicrobiales bacterium]